MYRGFLATLLRRKTKFIRPKRSEQPNPSLSMIPDLKSLYPDVDIFYQGNDLRLEAPKSKKKFNWAGSSSPHYWIGEYQDEGYHQARKIRTWLHDFVVTTKASELTKEQKEKQREDIVRLIEQII